jgi:hypothetical protein
MKGTDAMMFALGGLVMILFFGFLLAWPVMWLWNNCLVGAVAGVTEITWLQAWGIKILFSFLFKTTVTAKKD